MSEVLLEIKGLKANVDGKEILMAQHTGKRFFLEKKERRVTREIRERTD